MNHGEHLAHHNDCIAYYPDIAKMLKDVKAALFLSNFIRWYGKQHDKEGWIYKTVEEIHDETGLGYEEQKTVRRHLKDHGILDEIKKGIPRRLHFRIDYEKLDQLRADFIGKPELSQNNAKGFSSCPRETLVPVKGDPKDKPVGFPCAVTTKTSSKDITTTSFTPVAVVVDIGDDVLPGDSPDLSLARALITGSPFKDLGDDLLSGLAKKYGSPRLIEALDMLVYEYARLHCAVDNPGGLLWTTMRRGIVPPDGYHPLWRHDEDTRRAEQEERLAEQRRIEQEREAELDRMAAMFDSLPEAQREDLLSEARLKLHGIGGDLLVRHAAINILAETLLGAEATEVTE